MRYLKTYKGLVNEGFDIRMLNRERTDFESNWGFTIEDMEDILLELGDLSSLRGDCKIKTPTQELRVRYVEDKRIIIKKVPQLIVLANIKVTKEEYESIISTIKNRFSQMNIEVEDSTLEHERTNVELGIYFVCLRLMLKSDVKLLNNVQNEFDKSNIKIRYS